MEIPEVDIKKTILMWGLVFLAVFFLAFLIALRASPALPGCCPDVGPAFLSPTAWSFKASEEYENTSTYGIVELNNKAEQDLRIVLNGPIADDQILFKKQGASNCGWYGQVEISDKTRKIQPKKEGSGYVTIDIPKGTRITIKGIISGPANADTPTRCGGQTNSTYRWSITYSVILEDQNRLVKEHAQISGKYE